MFTLTNLSPATLTGAIFGVDQKFPGDPPLLMPSNTISRGILLSHISIVRITAPFPNVDGQALLLNHYLDGDLVFQGLADGASINDGLSPMLMGIQTVLIMGNDGIMYQYGNLLTPADITSFFVQSNSRALNLQKPCGPIDETQINFTGSGASRVPGVFDLSLPHLFEAGVNISEEQDVFTVQLIHDSLEVGQGNNGNTASQ